MFRPFPRRELPSPRNSQERWLLWQCGSLVPGAARARRKLRRKLRRADPPGSLDGAQHLFLPQMSCLWFPPVRAAVSPEAVFPGSDLEYLQPA